MEAGRLLPSGGGGAARRSRCGAALGRVVYNLGDLGYGTLYGLDELRAKALEIGVQNPIGHHVTNIVLTEESDGRVRAQSKAMGIQRDGTTGSVVYEDLLRLTPGGWRIVHRAIRRTKSGGYEE